MKILLWPTLYLPNIGGLEKMVHSLALSLVEEKHEVIVLSNALKMDSFSMEGISVFTFPFISALFGYKLSLVREILERVSELLEEFSPDIINIHGWYECFSFYQARALENRKTPVSLTLHGMLEQTHYETENCLKLWQRVETVNAVSHAIVPKNFHPHLEVIHNGLSFSKRPLKPLSENRLLLIGRLSREKCFSTAFYALHRLLLKYPSLELTLVGDGPEREKLLQLRKDLNLPVNMVGFVSPHEVESFIDQSTVVVIPSSYESFSLVALEAAFRGRPVVASRVLGLKEVVEDQETGILVEPEDIEGFVGAIGLLLSDPLLREKMGKRAFERAISHFTIEKTRENYLRMYEKALSLCHYPGL